MIEVNIFIPCFVDQLYPETGMNMVRILEKIGCRVQYNPQQTCCGQPAYNAGFFKEAAEVADKFMDDFGADTYHYVVAPSASCVGMVKNGYGQLYGTDCPPEKQRDYNRLRNRMHELSDFIVNVMKVERIAGAHFDGKVAYHDSCSGLRECGIFAEPRKLLSHVRGLTLVDMPENETCCGFGGTFAVKFEAISVAMAQQKVDNALAAGADTIVSTDTSCLMHLESYIKRNKIPMRTMHLADVLAAGLN